MMYYIYIIYNVYDATTQLITNCYYLINRLLIMLLCVCVYVCVKKKTDILFDQYFNQMHTLHPCQTTQNQYKYNNHNKHGNSI